MKRKAALSRKLHLLGDPSELKKEIEILQKMGVVLRRPSEFQLKIGELNYYWTTGRITQDPNRLKDERGFKGLLKIIKGSQAEVLTINLDNEDDDKTL